MLNLLPFYGPLSVQVSVDYCLQVPLVFYSFTEAMLSPTFGTLLQ